MKTINGLNIDHIYGLNPLRKNGWYFFCPKKTTLKPQKEKKSEFYQQKKVFQLNQKDLIEVQEKEGSKPVWIQEKPDTKIMLKL